VSPVQDLNRLVTSFTERVPDVAHAAVVSADGLPLAASAGLPRDQADQLAAVTSGLTKLVQGAARIFSGGPVAQSVVLMERGMLIMMSMSGNSVLAVLAAPECDMGTVAYEMTLLGDRVGPSLDRVTPRGWWRSYRHNSDLSG
jgi:predicted regulator of Ras-like GTPase activity (Roadblock/LC7/MglB family)